MLVISQKKYQTIEIGPDIKITILGRNGTATRLGITAPSELKVIRHEGVLLDGKIREYLLRFADWVTR